MTLGKFKKQFKYIVLVVISLAVFAATILLGRTASNYFTRASSCPVKNVRVESVSPNSSTIVWETGEETLGRVEYGINTASLTFTAPEASSSVNHSVPLTLLTPNTVYYYMIAIGETRCDSSGQVCREDGSCAPYTFTTSPLTPDEVRPTGPAVRPTAVPVVSGRASTPAPTSSLSLFCKAVQANIGKNSQVATEWATLKTYDIDGNNIINGLDVFKCQKSGK